MHGNNDRSYKTVREVGMLKSRLIVKTAHAFNPLLASISSAANALKEEHDSGGSEQSRLERLAEIQNAVQQLSQMLENLQTINRIYAGNSYGVTFCSNSAFEVLGVSTKEQPTQK